MPNQPYPYGMEGFLCGEISWKTSVVRACLIRQPFHFDPADITLSDMIDSGNDISATADVSGKTWTRGTADCAPVEWSVAADNVPLVAIVFYQASAPAGGGILPVAQQRLIVAVDSDPSNAAFSVVPDGNLVRYTPSSNPDRLFSLGGF